MISQNETDAAEVAKLIPELFAFVKSALSKIAWTRGSKTTAFLKGKQIDDYVSEGIARYLEHPHKFDPTKGTLKNYLQYNIIQSLISNDARSVENRNAVHPILKEGEDEFELASTLSVETMIDDQLDCDLIIREIRKEINEDSDVYVVFEGLLEGCKRSNIIEEYGLTEAAFDNAKKRLTTIRKKVAAKFALEETR